jgi:hypothetical protein
MGLFRDIVSGVTGVPLGGSKKRSSSNSSDGSNSNPDDTGASSDYGEKYGTSVLRAVKRSARRITDKGDDR